MQKVKKRLLSWYYTEGRKGLPWRETHDAYAIYISEIMLQQTQVATVLARFYHPFLEKFPTMVSLAEAKEETVMKAWQGLGYYQRARNLHRTAQHCVAQHGGQLPDSEEALLALPGIGKNTARAILCFGHRQEVAIMEANIKRVLSRFYALEAPSDTLLWERADDFLHHGESFDHNQAMMDLGAMVCTKTNPDCANCPLNFTCLGKSDPEYYTPTISKKVPTKHFSILVHCKAPSPHQNGEIQLAMAPRSTRLLQGMHSFVMQPKENALPQDAVLLGHVQHAYSHFKVEGDVYISDAPAPEGFTYYPLTVAEAMPHSTLEEKIFRFIK